jgi:hypothetical protein
VRCKRSRAATRSKATLRTADADGLDVERRGSEETVMPVDPEK